MKFKARYTRYAKLSDEELLERLLKNRGVEDPERLLNVDSTSLCPTNFNNLERGYKLLQEHIEKGSKILIIPDCDVDGVTSAAFTYLWLQTNAPKCELDFVIHTKAKSHGIDLKDLEGREFDLLVVPDAGTNDKKECEKLVTQGKDILIPDHHRFEVEDYSNDHIAIINCMDGVYENQELSGVGVCYKFFREYERAYNVKPISNSMLDLVALGMVGDMMDLRSLESRFLVNKGIEIMKDEEDGNYFINCIIEKVKGRMGEPTIKGIGWNIAPLINGVIRIGEYEDNVDMFKAFIGVNETRMYQPRRKSKDDEKPDPIEEDLQTYMARKIMSLKAKQDRELNKQVEEIKKTINDYNLATYNKIIMLDVTGQLDKTFTGYVAGKLANYYKRPILLLRGTNEKDLGGSGRNYSKFAIDNLNEFLISLETFDYVSGHDNAFGIGIQRDKIEETQNKINEALKDVEIEDVYHVDYAIPFGRLRPRHIYQVGQFAYIWGNGLDTPLFAITDLWVKPKDIRLMGDKQNVLKIEGFIGDNRITFIKTGNAKETYDLLTGANVKGIGKRPKDVGLNIIGEFVIHEYEEYKYPQVNIVDFEILKERKLEF